MFRRATLTNTAKYPLLAGPVALAWSRLDDGARERVRRRYLDSLAAWRHGPGYRVPGEFVFVTARVP